MFNKSALAISILFYFAGAAQGDIFPLGDLAGGSFSSTALGISADGLVVVGNSDSANGQEAFRWTLSGGMVGLGDLPGGIFRSDARGISADGSVISGTGYSPNGDEAFRWTQSGGMVGLGFLPGGNGSESARIYGGVSADGSVVVGNADSANCQEAFRWTESDGMVGLGDLPGGDCNGDARGISADGLVIVGRGWTAISCCEAYRWTEATGMVGLGDLPGGDFNSRSVAASADGAVVVGRSISSNGTEAFRWTESDGMVALGDLAGGNFFSRAESVSADGSVVVGTGSTPNGIEAIVWTSDSGMVRLADLLAAQGDDLSHWSNLALAYGVSADGRTIVGYGTNINGDTEAFVATLSTGGPVCAGSGTLVEGFGETGDFNATCGSDDSYWAAHGASLFFQISDPVVQFELTATAPAGFGGSTISVDIEASKQNDIANLNLRALLFNFTTGSYVSLPGIMPLTTTDAVQNFALPAGSDPADFIEPGTNEVRLLLQTIQTSGLPNVRTQLDEVLFNFE